MKSMCGTKILSLKKRHFNQVILTSEDMPTFIQPTFLTLHQKITNKEKPCVRKICGKNFDQNSIYSTSESSFW